MFCPNCGTRIKEGTRFCGNCGTQIESAEAVQEEKQQKPDASVQQPIKRQKRLSLSQILVFAECIILVAVIGIFFWAGSTRNSAESVADRYFQAYADGNWEEVYDLSEYPSGRFLQKDQFLEMMGEDAGIPEITGFEVKSEQSSQSSGIQKLYNVEYTVKGQGTYTQQLRLAKQSEKSMLFFDTWKVVPDSQLAQDYTIYAPKGASVTIDGIALTDTEKTEDSDGAMDSYVVTLFTGTHELQAAAAWCELYETEFTAYSGDSYTISGMTMTEEGKTAIQAKMQEALEMFYEAALTGKDFSAVEDLFLDEYREEGEESYDYLVSDIFGSDRYILDQVTFSDFECETDTDSSDGLLLADMDYDYVVQYTYTYTSWRDDSETSEARSYDGSSYLRASFGYDGETYKLASINIYSVL